MARKEVFYIGSNVSSQKFVEGSFTTKNRRIDYWLSRHLVFSNRYITDASVTTLILVTLTQYIPSILTWLLITRSIVFSFLHMDKHRYLKFSMFKSDQTIFFLLCLEWYHHYLLPLSKSAPWHLSLNFLTFLTSVSIIDHKILKISWISLLPLGNSSPCHFSFELLR